MNRLTVAILAVAALAALAGCMEVTMTTDVNADGELSSVTLDVDMEEAVHEELEGIAADEGHESVGELFNATLQAELDDGAENYLALELPSDRGVQVTVIASQVEVDAVDDVETTVTNETVTYEDAAPHLDPDPLADHEDEVDEDLAVLLDQASVTYRVEMPGSIDDTNAHELEDNETRAVWNLDDHPEGEPVYAESSRDDAIPGFGLGTAALATLIGLAGIALFARLRPP